MVKATVRNLMVSILLLSLSLPLIASAPAKPFPQVIPLPNGFQPEGIATGQGTTFYVGSIPTGRVLQNSC
jgi:hypothetical protein